MDQYCLAIIPLIIVVIAIVFSESNRKNGDVARREISQKQSNYTNALTALRADPTNPALHEQALQLGRIYSAATRENKAVTLFDETALANDIRAVTANATQTTVPVAASAATVPSQSIDDRINTLLKLKASGLITDAEFDHKRKELLDSI